MVFFAPSIASLMMRRSAVVSNGIVLLGASNVSPCEDVDIVNILGIGRVTARSCSLFESVRLTMSMLGSLDRLSSFAMREFASAQGCVSGLLWVNGVRSLDESVIPTARGRFGEGAGANSQFQILEGERAARPWVDSESRPGLIVDLRSTASVRLRWCLRART